MSHDWRRRGGGGEAKEGEGQLKQAKQRLQWRSQLSNSDDSSRSRHRVLHGLLRVSTLADCFSLQATIGAA